MRFLKPNAPYQEREHAGGVQAKQQFGQAELCGFVGKNDIAGGDKPDAPGIRFAAHMRNRHVRTGCQAQPKSYSGPGPSSCSWLSSNRRRWPKIRAKAKHFRGAAQNQNCRTFFTRRQDIIALSDQAEL